LIIRHLKTEDYNQYSNLIDSNITFEKYSSFLNSVLGDNHLIIVGEEKESLVATGTLLVEEKLTYGSARMGHIENILVDPSYRKKGYGRKIVEHLVQIAQDKNCYKVSLSCTLELESFYDKIGLKKHEISMRALFLDRKLK
jgi:glucosamine-phosphate N-acetyltransferase|tara:strand:- start:38 stop:460 length:423 start_codon:yes stop_codon:yes gene_type:complete